MFRVDNTIFSGAWIPERGTSYAQESDRMQALDLNSDGYPDLFSPNGTGFISLPDGRYYTASMGTSVTACEVNGDGLRALRCKHGRREPDAQYTHRV